MKKNVFQSIAIIILLNVSAVRMFAAINPYEKYAPCGIPLQDAIGVQMLLQKSTTDALAKEMLISVLQQYTSTQITGTSNLNDVFKDNPWLAAAFAVDSMLSPSTFTPYISTEGGSINGAGSPVNGLASPTTAIDAIGTFIATRFKEELNIAFLDKFREAVAADPNFPTLFPKTTLLLTTVEPYNYTTFLKSLSEDFNADFKDMPENLPELMKKRVSKKYRTDAFYLFLVYADVISAFENGSTPPQIINRISMNTYLDSLANSDVRSALQLSGLISRSIGSRTVERFWAPASQVQLLAQPFNSQLRLLFLGFIYENEKPLFTKIKFNNKDLNTLVSMADAQIVKFCNYISEIHKQFEVTQQLLFGLKNKLSNLTVEDITRYAKSFLEITDISFNIEAWTGAAISNLAEVRAKYLPVVYRVIDTWNAVESKQYGLALTCVISFSNDFLPGDSLWKANLTKYGTFMVNMMNAKTSEEMVAALEGAALPAGSYRIKRNNYGNISLNAYGGFLVGYGNEFHFGFTAPVGIAFSRGLRGTSKKGNTRSVTLFFPIIDVGAVTIFRLQDSQAVLPEMAWQDIISPGAYLVFGCRNSPLAFNFGTQYGPALRKVDQQTNEVIAKPGWMLNVGVTVDIPVFSFHTRGVGKVKPQRH